ncbi:hypothetical protein GA0070623_3564 [Micromonospora rifamycinica]|uniref:Uncharacterized protein n=1 Tax=Micromonospora rifamycinica TaxID=291594 RepID=A0A1C5JKL9_9ACTN|nr:hypothetical protein GA0070623_3564 [Micromonospora rifamycinica]
MSRVGKQDRLGLVAWWPGGLVVWPGEAGWGWDYRG